MKSFIRIFAITLILGFPIVPETVIADETAGEAAVSEGRAAKNKVKRKWRKADNDSAGDHIKDGAKNAADSAEGAAKTAKDKVD